MTFKGIACVEFVADGLLIAINEHGKDYLCITNLTIFAEAFLPQPALLLY
jgi:hypothetical protein